MDDYQRKKHLEFLKENSKKFKNKSELSSADLEYLFHSLIDLLGLPYPPSELQKYFLHPNVISDMFIEVLNSDYLSPDDRFKSHESFNKIFKAIKKARSNYNIDFRILASGGNYPNIELSRGGCKYTINNQIPVLQTKSWNKKDIMADSSIINWLSRIELKFATSVMCAPEYGSFSFYFTSHNTIKVDESCYKKVPNELKIYFLRELLDIKRRYIKVGVKPWNRKPLPDVNEYEFSDYQESVSTFHKIFDNFSIQDDLLLRTCNYFVKARMHWDNLIYAEEAITNNFFCLEGCLHLIQKKYGDFNPKLNRKLLSKVFKEEIPNGENLFDFIQEGYSTRISLVHPEPEWGAEWDPFIMADDFYEYYKICRILLNFILIDRVIDDY